MNESRLVGFIALGALAYLAGCGSSYTATLQGQTPMPDGSWLTPTAGNLHTGMATAFTPQVTESDTWGQSQQTSDIVVASNDPSVLQAAAVTNGGQWIVWAVAPGSAELTITQNGNVAATIAVQVTDPP
jgi:hypothetical protein